MLYSTLVDAACLPWNISCYNSANDLITNCCSWIYQNTTAYWFD